MILGIVKKLTTEKRIENYELRIGIVKKLTREQAESPKYF